jgi:hypothetical protein
MSVQLPPKIAPKASGISSFRRRNFRAVRQTQNYGNEHRRRRRVLQNRSARRRDEHYQSRQKKFVVARNSVKPAPD